MNCWKIYKLSEVCQVDKSQGIHKGLPYVGMEDVEAHTGNFLGSYEPQTVKSSTFKFNTGHVLYGRLRPYLNKVLVADFSGHCSTEIFPLKPSTHLHKRFLFYWLTMASTVEQINRTCTGARMPRANMKEVMEFDIPLPPLPEQKRIVAILDEAFAGIDAAVANTEKNLANGRELFESYLNGVFTQKGDGWVEKTLGEVCRINSKLVDPREPEFIDLPHLGAGNMVSRTGELIEIQTAREEGLISGKFLFDEKMVLYSKIRPYLMKACMPDFKGLCSADVYPLSPIDGSIDRSYLFHLLMSHHFTDYAIIGSGRAGMPKVNRDHLFKYSVSLPDIAEQRQFAAKFDDLFAETNRLETIYQQKLIVLAELKQSILQKAFAGELTAQSDKSS